MSLQITIDLNDADLQFFIDAAKRAQAKAGNLSPKQITDAAGKLLVDSKNARVPEFIASRLSKLDAMISMVNDAGWDLSETDKKRVLSALTYFADPDDVIPDNVPVLGFLDDAIMIELCQRELQHEIDAYEEFVAHRVAEAKHRRRRKHRQDAARGLARRPSRRAAGAHGVASHRVLRADELLAGAVPRDLIFCRPPDGGEQTGIHAGL